MRANCKLFILFLVFAGRVESAQPDTGELHRLQAGLERMLNENIVSFWYPKTLDSAGGFRLNHDGQGDWLVPADKVLVVQARTVWFFSRLYNDGYGGEEHIEAAKHGFEFLRDKMWDPVFGGFFHTPWRRRC